MARKKKEDLSEDKLKSVSGEGGTEEEKEEKETVGSKLLLVVVTLFIIVLWLAIFALFIKMDLGGFGSGVLKPLLKDVPVVNKILPEGGDEGGVPETEVDTQYMYDSLDDAVAEIKRLEKEVQDLQDKNKKQKDTIKDLKAQVADLSKYKEEQAAFEKEKEKYYEEVVFGDKAPDINEYKTYYESIEPDNAEVLYKQVLQQNEASEEVEEYVKKYSSMKPKAAAGIFDTMTDNLNLVANILEHMSSAAAGDILAQMTPETAAKVTEIMDPDIAHAAKKRAASAANSGNNNQ